MENTDIILEKIILQNYKGFFTGDIEENSGIEISFDRHLTIFIGNNGVGKSSILDAIAIALLKLRQKITDVGKGSLYPFPLPSKEKKNRAVNNEAKEAIISAYFDLGNAEIMDKNEHEMTKVPKIGFSIFMEKEKPPSTSTISKWEQHTKDASTNDEQTFDLFLRDYIHDPYKEGSLGGVPILAYYGTNSIHTDLLNQKEEVETAIFDAYQDALDATKFSFTQFFLWLDDQQKRLVQSQEREVNFSKMEYVSHVISLILDDEHTIYKDLRVFWLETPNQMYITKCNKQTGKEEHLAISQLSSGERTLIALVADLTRRLCLANPGIKNPLEGNGIVLIDEIDLHLHPNWQRKVVPKLRELFPNLQFILTTHSPQVLGETQEGSIYTLENKEARLLEFNTYGKDMNRILDLVMGDTERNKEILEMFNTYFKLIEENAPQMMEKAQEFREKLESLIGTDEPLFRRADGIIKRKQLLGR